MNTAIIKQVLLLRKVPIIILAVLFVIAAAMQIFIIFFQQPEVEKMKDLWLQSRSEDAGAGSVAGRGSRYKVALADLQKFREKIYPKSHFAKFITELYDVASKNRLELTTVTYKPTHTKDDNLILYSLNLAVSGNYLQLKRFINDLSRCNNLLVIDNVTFESQNSASDTVQLQVQITTYFKMEAQ